MLNVKYRTCERAEKKWKTLLLTEIRSTAHIKYSCCYLVSKTRRYVSQRLANDVHREN